MSDVDTNTALGRDPLVVHILDRLAALEKHVGLTPEAPKPQPLSPSEQAELDALLARRDASQPKPPVVPLGAPRPTVPSEV